MGDFRTVGRADDVPVGEARAFTVDDKVVAVARTSEGWHAFDDTCTHQMCSLAEGEIDDDVVVCPCHGSEFAIATGEVMNGPADESIETYEVRVENGELQISV
jgi:nitrite reductase/ring-hydroxylating ferredoxin subunit